MASPEELERIEALGLQALRGELSWSAAAKALGWGSIKPLQNHMENHYKAALERELSDVEDEFQASINAAADELLTQMRFAAPEVKPLYAAAIQNLRGLRDTKASQQHLIMAMKAIQEMTGMKQEQRLMLQFAEHMFRELPSKAKEALPVAAPIMLELEAMEAD